jgi:hypothetical protein
VLTCTAFKKSVNMSPAAILKWLKDPRAKLASFEATRRRLPRLAELKRKKCTAWTKQDEKLAKRVLSFNARMSGVVKQYGCTTKAVISLRNWGRSTKCPLPARAR